VEVSRRGNSAEAAKAAAADCRARARRHGERAFIAGAASCLRDEGNARVNTAEGNADGPLHMMASGQRRVRARHVTGV
jgi:hypothetical protein